MKEGSFHLFFTFPSTPSKTHPPQKKMPGRLFIIFFSQRFLNKKIIVNFVFVLFPPDLDNFKSKGVETFPPLTLFHTQLCWPFLMYYVRKMCIHYANFHDCNFLGTNCELLWRQTFFSLEALSMLIMMMYFTFHAHVNCV